MSECFNIFKINMLILIVQLLTDQKGLRSNESDNSQANSNKQNNQTDHLKLTLKQISKPGELKIIEII